MSLTISHVLLSLIFGVVLAEPTQAIKQVNPVSKPHSHSL